MNWSIQKAKVFCFGVTDGTHDSPKAIDVGRYLITSKHLGEYEIDFCSAKMISEDDYKKIIARSKVRQWDILFSMIGTIGNCYLEKNKSVEYACKNIGIFQMGGDEEKAYWLYYYLKSPQAKEYIFSHLRGSTQQYIPLGSLREFPIPVLEKENRKKIIAILKSIDGRIELNNKINENLSQQIQLIYNEFADGLYGNTFELSSIIDVRDGTHDSPKSIEGGYPLVTSKHLLPYGVDLSSANLISKEDFEKTNERSLVETYDILISMIGTVGLISLVIENPVPYAIKNVGLFKTSKRPDLFAYILPYLRSTKTTQHIERALAGSTQKYISLGELRKLPIILPDEETLKRYNNIVFPLIKQIINLIEENKRLIGLRDTLLPRLMSGELDVSSLDI